MKTCPNCTQANAEEYTRCKFCGEVLDIASYGDITHKKGPSLSTISIYLGFFGLCTGGLTALLGLVVGMMALYDIFRYRDTNESRENAIGGLLISTGVLGLIACLLLPTIPSYEVQKQYMCRNNMQQLGLAILMYTQDYDERYPLRNNWCEAIQSYVKNKGVYQCPSLRRARSGYAYNALLSGMHPKRIASPHDTALIFDAKRGVWNLSGGPELADFRHREGLNVGFADGHIKSIHSLSRIIWDPKQKPPPQKPSP